MERSDCIFKTKVHSARFVPTNILEAELAVEGSCSVVDWVDGNEPGRCVLTGPDSLENGINQETAAVTLPLGSLRDRQTAKQDHADWKVGKAAAVGPGQLGWHNLPHRE